MLETLDDYIRKYQHDRIVEGHLVRFEGHPRYEAELALLDMRAQSEFLLHNAVPTFAAAMEGHADDPTAALASAGMFAGLFVLDDWLRGEVEKELRESTSLAPSVRRALTLAAGIADVWLKTIDAQ